MTPQQLMRRLKRIQAELAELAEALEVPVERMAERCLIREIQMQVSDVTRVPIEQMLGEGREEKQVRARYIAIWVARQVTGQSMANLARAFKRDRATVVYGIRAADAWRRDDPKVRALTDRLLASFQSDGRRVE